VVNGSKLSLRPIDPRGGILADDMGLGKTLAVLSQILATQTAAQDFMANPAATEPNTIQTIANGSLTPLKATLVVVPLSRKDNPCEGLRFLADFSQYLTIGWRRLKSKGFFVVV
jgi:SNF2 family DNA or RNA helicase